jgi:hypothetical protein
VGEENPSKLPVGYTLDLVGDPCVIVLLRADGTVVARFTRNVDPKEVRRAAEEDSAAGGKFVGPIMPVTARRDPAR